MTLNELLVAYNFYGEFSKYVGEIYVGYTGMKAISRIRDALVTSLYDII